VVNLRVSDEKLKQNDYQKPMFNMLSLKNLNQKTIILNLIFLGLMLTLKRWKKILNTLNNMVGEHHSDSTQ